MVLLDLQVMAAEQGGALGASTEPPPDSDVSLLLCH
ncbi:SapB/AmfS family lanthipeptide [Streptomyces roseoverticillatus]